MNDASMSTGSPGRAPAAAAPGQPPAPRLERQLTAVNLTLLGVGAVIGAGIFVITGTAAAHYAGPAIALSFVIAAVACLCAGLCYAELAAMFPVAGSAYSYARAALGPFGGWTVGWCILLEYLFACGAISSGWGGYFVAACADFGVRLPHAWVGAPLAMPEGHLTFAQGSHLNIPAAGIVLLLTAGVVRSVRTSAFINNAIVAIKVVVIALFLIIGALYIDPANWHPFIPPNTGEFGQFGWSGVMRGAGAVFFAYLGFDAVSTAGQEARNPQRDMPRALIGALLFCTVLYVLMSIVMTGLTSYRNLSVPNPVSVAIRNAGAAAAWLEPVVDIGIVAGLTSVMLTLIYAQSRVLYAISCDGLLPAIFSRVHARYHTPHWSILVVGAIGAVLGAVLPLEIIGNLVSMGTLFAFTIVCIAVLRLRRTHPMIPRPFRLRPSPFVPVLGILICVYLMSGLGGAVWLRFTIWLAIGAALYAAYGRHRHRAGNPFDANASTLHGNIEPSEIKRNAVVGGRRTDG
jgi:basic amino acid/polyamine antiporter, APA family